MAIIVTLIRTRLKLLIKHEKSRRRAVRSKNPIIIVSSLTKKVAGKALTTKHDQDQCEK